MERWRLSRSTVAQGPPKTTKDHRGLQSNNAFKANWAARSYRGYVGNITSHYHRHHDWFYHVRDYQDPHHLRNHHQGQLSTSRTPKGYVGCRKNMFSDFGTNTFVGFCLLTRAEGLFKNMPAVETLAPLWPGFFLCTFSFADFKSSRQQFQVFQLPIPGCKQDSGFKIECEVL